MDAAAEDKGPHDATFRDLATAVLISLAAEVILGILITIVAQLQYGKNARAHMSEFMVYITPVSLGLSFFLSYYFVCVKYGRSFISGFRILPLTGRELVRYLGIALLLVVVAIGALAVAYAVAPSSLSGRSMVVRTMQNPHTAAFWMSLALCAPLVEELFYRGFAFAALQRRFNTRSAFFIVTAWFAGMHIPQVAGDWPSMVGITSVSIVITWLRASTRSLTPSILVHLLYNTSLVLLSYCSMKNMGEAAMTVYDGQFAYLMHLLNRR